MYEEYNRYFSGEKPQFDRQHEVQKKQLNRVNVFKQYGFTEIEDKLYYGTRTLNASDYATLCGTYSDHRAIPEDERIIFLQKIENTINRCGGKFEFADMFLLCMSKKSYNKTVVYTQ